MGDPGVPVTLPFASLFLTKQPTAGGENAMTISWPYLKSPFFLTFFLIKVLMRSSTPLPLAFYLKIFRKISSENWTNLEAILHACPSHYSHCSSETCHIKPKHGVEVDMTIS